MRGFPVGWFDRFHLSAAPPDDFSSHSETHGPVGVQPVINKDEPFASKIFAAFFSRG
jgi:hypothetical protein